MINSFIKNLLISSSINKKSSWAIVRNGAVSEFSITSNDKPNQYFDNFTNTLTVETNKANLKIKLDDSITPIIAENANYRCAPWSQNIYLCIPKQQAILSKRNKLTHVQNWNREEINGELWDLGIGYPDLDAYIIVNDANLHQYLKQKEGNYIINDSKVLNEIVKFSPRRLFTTKFASITVKQKIPINKDEVDGPHTHLLPQIIINQLNFPIPIDNNVSSQIQVDPYGGAIDGKGNFIDWNGFENDEFQFILKNYGNEQDTKNKNEIKDTVCDFLENGDIKLIIDMYKNSSLQNQMRIIIAQIVCDKAYSLEYRKKGLFILKKINAINYPVLRQWINHKSPELLN
jgi:hypothetical protein